MKVFKLEKLKKLNLKIDVCTIGNFDGIHLAHKKILSELEKKDGKKAIFTFSNKTMQSNELFSISEKLNKLKKYNVNYIIVFNLNENIKNTKKEDFIKYLKQLNVKTILLGNDFSFSKNKEGNYLDLAKEFEVISFKDIFYNEKKISTTLIKEMLKTGNLNLSNKLLGNTFYTIGKVVKGNKIGRQIGYKTANINYTNLLPANGVYLTKCIIGMKKYYSITNIGYNPSINKQEKIRLETHIIDFNKNIYNKKIKLYYLEFLRKEEKFNSKDELINQLNKDLQTARKSIKERI